MLDYRFNPLPNVNSKSPVFYAEEALALHDYGKDIEALDILDKAKQNRCADNCIATIRAKILQAQNR